MPAAPGGTAPLTQQPTVPTFFNPSATPVQAPVTAAKPPLSGVAMPGHISNETFSTPPPGWNDPPALKSSRAPKKPDPAPASAPITHPLFGVDPNQNQNQNGYTDQYGQYQPPPPTANSNMSIQTQTTAPGNYYNPTLQQNNIVTTQQFPQQMNFQTSAISQQSQQQQSWNTQLPNVGYTEQPAPVQIQQEPPKEKPPLPDLSTNCAGRVKESMFDCYR
ncbi:uncharacterized protein [Eurosta solidaginis]|uniref:uncharacterized protein isoform X2 n=1 Tax=Eurosta solidaginis TaxID=178769 RepID=UPI00353120E5